MAQEHVDALVDLLDLEPIEVNIFRGVSPQVNQQRVFGGQVAGQALVAAGRTVDLADGAVHSLHAYFLRPGDPSVPILYEVDRIRDGRSFTTRRVVAIQHGKAIFNLSASFQVAQAGPEHQVPMPPAPEPESLPTWDERREAESSEGGNYWKGPRPVDVRHVDWEPAVEGGRDPLTQRAWMRTDGKLPDDPLVHACVLTYASDLTLLDAAMSPHFGRGVRADVQIASLDHAMWFHRPFRMDEWLLYAQDSPSAGSARGLARGLIFDRQGRLVASVVQEGLMRPMRPAP
jgi:acyl-CoA thioesterase-2